MKNLSSPLISVIVPVYNTEKYLRDCLLSLQKQSFLDFEVVIVDDGSTDNSYEIAHKFEIDPRFKIYQKPNGGLADARKAGFELSKGKYISFVDSDDIVSPHFLSNLFESLASNNCDISVCGMFTWNQTSGFISCNLPKESRVIDKKDFAKVILSLKGSNTIGAQGGYLCNKLFRRSLIKREDFIVIDGAEDEVFLFRLLERISSVIFVPIPLYYYRMNPNSLTFKKGFRFAHILSRHLIVESSTGETRKVAIIGWATQIFATLIAMRKGIEKDPRLFNLIKKEINQLKKIINEEKIDLEPMCPFPSKKELILGKLIGSKIGPLVVYLYQLKHKLL